VESVSRRIFLRRAMSAAIVAPLVLRRSYRLIAQPAPEYPERVMRLMRESLVIDMLNHRSGGSQREVAHPAGCLH
jgi:hypothetical protein